MIRNKAETNWHRFFFTIYCWCSWQLLSIIDHYCMISDSNFNFPTKNTSIIQLHPMRIIINARIVSEIVSMKMQFHQYNWIPSFVIIRLHSNYQLKFNVMQKMHITSTQFLYHGFVFDLLINKSTLGNKLYSRIININNSREMNIHIQFQHVCKIVCRAHHIIIHSCHTQCIFKDDIVEGIMLVIKLREISIQRFMEIFGVVYFNYAFVTFNWNLINRQPHFWQYTRP